MDRLWAPWRMEYIKHANESGCIFCQAIKSNNDRKNLVIYRGKTSFIIMNRYPYNPGHLMIAPNDHKSNFDGLEDDEILELIRLLGRSMRVLQDAVQPDGFNMGINLGRIAGAGIEGHLHIHVVPRWQGDTNFMPVIGETKVVSEALEATYDHLKKQF